MPSRRADARLHHDAAVTLEVPRDLVHQRDAGVRAPRVLHAARGHEPERVVLEPPAARDGVLLPDAGEVLVRGQRLVLGELAVPPPDPALVQPAAELRTHAREPFLERHLEAQALLHELGVEIPGEPRDRLRAIAVLAVPVEPLARRAAGDLGARRAADAVPDLLRAVPRLRLQPEVVARAGQRHARGAAVDRLVVLLEESRARGELGRDVGEVARVAARHDRRLAQREALVIPELLDELRAADADELRALDVGALGQQHVGHPVRLVDGVGERDDERELGDPLRDLGRVPERDRGIGAIDEPDVRRGHRGPVLRRLLAEHPREMRRPERVRPRRVRRQRHERRVRVADARLGGPVLAVGRIHRVGHEPVRSRLHARLPRRGGAVEPHGRAERPAGHLERADEARGERPRPAAFVAAPAVRHRLAERDRHRPQRQLDAVDHRRRADARVREVLGRDAPDRAGPDVAHALGPLGRVLAPCARRAR